MSNVIQEQRGRILVVRIDRERKRNAIDTATALGLDEALNRLDDDPGLWAGVLTGTTTVFCAGTDLNEPGSPGTERGGEYGLIRRRRAKPLVAAVEGPAYGGGFELVLACDLVVASTTARFALPEVRRGLVASAGGLVRATRGLPPNVARELLIGGLVLGPERAYELGLVNRVCEPGRALEEGVALAEEVCAGSPVAVRAALAALQSQLDDADAAGWDATAAARRAAVSSADAEEGRRAFFERRPPRWAGR
jgi:enoyl-CoA hydratase/carnithine racemase